MNLKSRVVAHLSKELRAQYKRRSMPVRKGDEIKIIRGESFGRAGEVTQVDTKGSKIFVSGVTLKRTIGTEKQIPIEPSNVVITSMNLNDGARQRILLRKVKEVVVPKKEASTPAPVEKKEEKPVEEQKTEAPKAKPVAAIPKAAVKAAKGGK